MDERSEPIAMRFERPHHRRGAARYPGLPPSGLVPVNRDCCLIAARGFGMWDGFCAIVRAIVPTAAMPASRRNPAYLAGEPYLQIRAYHRGISATERRRNRTFQAWGCHALPVLKCVLSTSD